MRTNLTKTQSTIIFIGAVAGWFALITQLYLILANRTTSIAETLFRYFGFFTILTNIMVALCFTALLFRKDTFFHKASTQTAIAVYILVVGAVYNIILRFLWAPQGLQKIVDELLHTIVPLLYILYWFLYRNRAALPWKNAFTWLLYPLIYIVYTLVRGSVVHFYPYPFINVDKLGYATVFKNSILLTFVFFGLSLLFIAITRRGQKTPVIRHDQAAH